MTIGDYTKGLRKYITCFRDFALKNSINPTALIADGIWCWFRYGCVLNQFIDGKFYKRKGFERKRILTYRKWGKLISKYNDKDYIHILQNKIDFNKYYKDYIGRDWLYSKEMNISQFEEFVRCHGEELFVKPIDDNEGHGIRIINVDKGNINSAFSKLHNEEVLIEERLKQHKDMMFSAQSVNTIRAYTVYDKKEKKAYILKTTLRAGIGDAIVDNSHSGGVSYEVDKGLGIIISSGWSHSKGDVMIHPSTNIFMPGYQLPHWSKVTSLIVKAAEMIPNVQFIGWDVAIKEDGPVLIEGNHDPDLDLLEFVGSYGYYHEIMTHLKN